MIILLKKLGFIINYPKSTLIPPTPAIDGRASQSTLSAQKSNCRGGVGGGLDKEDLN